ncbi:MAG: serine/threonine-protein kinase [Planctomycetota bacterium]
MTPESVEQLFRVLFLADLEGDEPRSLETYRDLFPGHEDVVETLYERLCESETTGDLRVPVTPAIFPSGPGDMIGRFKILRELGRGGQAIVYLAADDELGRQVAVKVLTKLGPGSEGTLQRFKREAEVCSRLDVPGICTVYEAHVEGGIPFIVMQYIEGITLAQQLSRRNSTQGDSDDFDISLDDEAEDALAAAPDATAADAPDKQEIESQLKTFEAAAQALDAAHRAGILHRDIKPGNIMVQPDSMPVVLDFGLARSEEETHLTLTQTGDFFGTPAYMSPEQISAHRIRLDERSDVFSLAVTLFECLTLRRPFDSASREGIYQAILMKDPPNPRRINPAISRDLAVVLEKALEKDRDRRYRNAGDLAEELRRVRSFEPIEARPADPILRLRRWTQRHPGVAAMVALLAVVLGLGFAFFLYHSDKQEKSAAAARAEEEARERDEFSADVRRRGEKIIAIVKNNPFNLFLYQGMIGTFSVDVVKMGEEGKAYARSLVTSEEATRRAVATILLQYVPDSSAIDDLRDLALNDKDDLVSSSASRSLIFHPHESTANAQREIRDEVLSRIKNKPTSYRGEAELSVLGNSMAGLVVQGDPLVAGGMVELFKDGTFQSPTLGLMANFLLALGGRDVLVFIDYLRDRIINGDTVLALYFDPVLAYYKKLGDTMGLDRLEELANDERLSAEMKEKVVKARDELRETLNLGTPD